MNANTHTYLNITCLYLRYFFKPLARNQFDKQQWIYYLALDREKSSVEGGLSGRREIFLIIGYNWSLFIRISFSLLNIINKN